MIYRFSDALGSEVHFSTEYHPFSIEPKHVLVILQCPDGWVLTKHRERGLEFPGGKREKGETIEEAAIREVWEETGAIISQLHYIGQYMVDDGQRPFVKDVYYAQTEAVESKSNYLETDGPAVLPQLPDTFDEAIFSFIMRDQVIKLSLQAIKKKHFG